MGFERTVAVLLLLAGISPVAAEIYRWVDKSGEVHFGDRPRPEGATVVEVPQTPGPDANLEQQRTREQRLLDAYQDEREVRSKAALEAKEKKEQSRQLCTEARARLRIVEESRRVSTVDKDGNRSYQYWNAESRAEARATAQKAIDTYCD